jgi:uncharacterized protein YkwD
MNWKILFLYSLTAISIACGGEDSDTPFNPNFGDAPTNPDETVLTNLINELRANGQKCNETQYEAVPALTFSTTLNEIAKSHANYMDSIDELTHTGENNAEIGERALAGGYNYTVIAENLARGYADEESVVAAWKDSGSHCVNMMNPDVREMGVGTSGAYWVMVYGVE